MVQVKLFDCEHEKDLESEINSFLWTIDEDNFVDIKFNVATMNEGQDGQIYCFSAMVIYNK
ncbi:sporulation protein Cse60 [Peribacillus saganii]|uniref:Sporulation protein Cse60 n=1 Tax=Peribacillus saganii TaxID=2303992 RepID=A0A372LMY9_9BACI|nr:sporulation protein Cse60 [Peribacillus saganii]RFU68756.1 sporulation protein Cse60 [Peribacillus saganii]